jgi:hypothetical protein
MIQFSITTMNTLAMKNVVVCQAKREGPQNYPGAVCGSVITTDDLTTTHRTSGAVPFRRQPEAFRGARRT